MEKSLGIDIHGDYAALTLVGKAMNRPTLLQAHWFPLSPDGSPEDTGRHLVEEIRRFLNQDGSSPKHVILGLPRRDIIVHALSLPSPDLNALDGIIQLELDRHLAAPIESLQMSYHALPLGDNLYHVLVAAAKKSLTEDYTRWASDANLDAKQITLALSSQIQILTHNKSMASGLHAILDVGPKSVEISLWKDKKVLISRYIPSAPANLGEQFFKKMSEGGNQELETFCVFLNKSLELTLDGCKTLDSNDTLEAIHIFGGGHAQQALVENLQSKTEIKVHTAPWPNIIKKSPPPELIPAFQLTSLGLALQPHFKSRFSLNLNAEGKPANGNGSLWKVSAVCALLLFVIALGIWKSKETMHEATLASLNQQLEEIKPKAYSLTNIDQEFSKLSAQLDSLNAIDRRSPLKLPILLELSRLLPKSTWVSRINIQPGRVEIKGLSASASGLIPKLEASPMFQEVTFKGSVIKRGDKENFTIQLKMESGDHEKPEA